MVSFQLRSVRRASEAKVARALVFEALDALVHVYSVLLVQDRATKFRAGRPLVVSWRILQHLNKTIKGRVVNLIVRNPKAIKKVQRAPH